MNRETMTRCNCCGRELKVKNEIPQEDFLHVDKTWGYFSGRDGMRDRFVVCEACYDRWIETFAVQPSRKETTELL